MDSLRILQRFHSSAGESIIYWVLYDIMKKTSSKNILFIAASEQDANLYYATRFIAPDEFIFAQINGKKILLMSDLEVDRARDQAEVDEVVSLSKLRADYEKKNGQKPLYLDLIDFFFKSRGANHFLVAGNFPLEYADALRKRNYTLEVRPEPFFEERTVKTNKEIVYIQQAIRHTEAAVGEAIKVLKKSIIKRGKLYFNGSTLTSEKIKQVINVHLMQNGLIGAHSIVACAHHAVDPHNQGSGPIFANESLIMDIFPRDSESRYFADFTRTVVRGKAKPKLKKMYDAVYGGQEIAFRDLKAGVDASAVHSKIHKYFESLGFKTGISNGRMQGFFHGTGHGLGLDIHEAPRFGGVSQVLKPGHVITVEPGLYYEDAGGVRLEDVVVITKTGCKNLTRFPKVLEI